MAKETEVKVEPKALVKLEPQSLLMKAIEGGASIETLERLVALAKEVQGEQAREAWHQAMAEFQRRCPTVKKSATAKIFTGKGAYTYHYAPLDEILATCRELLGELGLSVSWRSKMEPNRVIVSCRIAHVLGHAEESGDVAMPIPGGDDRSGANAAQRVGIALTYARRYSFIAVAGLAPEDDDDAAGLEIGHEEKADSPKPSKADTKATGLFLREMAAFKEKLGDEKFLAVLGECGWEDVKEIGNVEDQRAVWKACKAALDEQEPESKR